MSISGSELRSKQVRLGVVVYVDDYPEGRVVTLMFDDAAAKDWARCLNQLQRRAVESLVLTSNSSAFRLRVQRDIRNVGAARAWATWTKKEMSVRLTPMELDYWAQFFTAYMERGQAPVDHIDVETTASTPSRRRSTTLVLKVPKADPSVPVEQTIRRLGTPP